ncbi:cytochrome P450 CYP72A219-like [Cucurbita moschata]|uniref:Cytochrome P450 CYP72A219-like n=1 Tax=Cucurbita moschata TaxID=3662 RepID=A0A6J1F7R4_CUCMO|nr:cytochrome P450 CYP72A219-like [Cucurbita moschata]
MEYSWVGAAIAVIASLIAVWVSWGALNWVWIRPRKLEKRLREQGLAGNPYRILYGDLKESLALLKEANSKPMAFSHDIGARVLPSISNAIQNHGKNSYIWLGPYPRVNIMDPEQLNATFSLINDIQKPDMNPFFKFLLEGIITHEGEKWAKHRKIINPAFHLDKLKNMVPVFVDSSNEIVSEWERIVPEDGCCELDVMPYLQSLTRDAISRAAFGSSYKEGQMIFQLLKQLTDWVVKVAGGIYIPGWRFLPTKSNNKLKETNEEIKRLVLGIINKRQKAMKEGEAVQNDLLGILLDSNAKEIEAQGNNKDVGMSIEDVIKECKIFYIGGQETTAQLLTWSMILLSVYTEWQERARAEVREVFGDNTPNSDGLSRLKVVNMILHEVLRLYPPASMLPRVVKKETRVGKLNLPAGVMLVVPMVLIHRDREIWGEDANEFKPERFSNGVSNASKQQPAFLPFGWGPRICLGQNFAIFEAKIALSLILQRFSFELSPSYTHAPIVVMSIEPQHGAHIILRKLNKV